MKVNKQFALGFDKRNKRGIIIMVKCGREVGYNVEVECSRFQDSQLLRIC